MFLANHDTENNCCYFNFVKIGDFVFYLLFVVLLYLNNREAFLFHISVCHFERSFINNPGPCVLFATPGMISGGFSLEAFKKWAPSEKNLITLPGYAPYHSSLQHFF